MMIKKCAFLVIMLSFRTLHLQGASSDIPVDLFKAIQDGDCQATEHALENGADPNEIRVEQGFLRVTPLVKCLSLAHNRPAQKAIIEKLIEHKANINKPADSSGKSPLAEAILARDFDTSLLLLDYGADPDQRDSQARQAVDWTIIKLSEKYTLSFMKKVLDIQTTRAKNKDISSNYFTYYKSHLASVAGFYNTDEFMRWLYPSSSHISDHDDSPHEKEAPNNRVWCNFNIEDGYIMGGWAQSQEIIKLTDRSLEQESRTEK